MEKTYTSAQLVQAGKDLVDLLLNLCNSTNNISGFLKEYINNLTSEDGIFKKEQQALERFAQSSASINTEAEQMMETSRVNSEQIQNICSQFQALNDSITKVQQGRQEMDENVANLNSRIKEISAFTQNIKEVSEQTNLLSFNASIEAARAGVAGKGFRIIANEVKSLSERTNSLSSEIEGKVRELQRQIQIVAEDNRAHSDFMNSLQKTTVESSEKLLKINMDSADNSAFTARVLEQLSNNQKEMVDSAKKSEEENLAQISAVADRAARNTIQTGDEISFLFELKALFEYMSNHREIFA